MAQMTQAELDELQNLSDRYQAGADLPGPLIGDKLPMNVLVTEYAQADPTYVVKTTGLAATHTAYRSVKGDGQCGWRATVFSYFVILLKSRDLGLVQMEKIRFESYADQMKMVGIDYELMEPMFDFTWELFDAILHAVQNHNEEDKVILDIINDQNKSDSIVYHFKMVTSCFMKLNEDDFAPFMDMTVDEYRVSRIDPTYQEIDQIGLQALTNAVIRQAGFGLEVLYLDRSMGEEVTPHQFSEGNPVIRLLYRPGHYDIIYKETQPMQVFLQPQQHIPQQVDSVYHNYTPTVDLSMLFGPPPTARYDHIPSCNPPNTYMQHQPYPQLPYHDPISPQPMQYMTPPPQQVYTPVRHEPPPVSIPSFPTRPSATSSRHNSNSPHSPPVLPSAPFSPTSSTPGEMRFRQVEVQQRLNRDFRGLPIRNNSTSSNTNANNHLSSEQFQPQEYNPRDHRRNPSTR